MNINLRMVRRDDYEFDFTVLKNGIPADITGGTLLMTAKWQMEDPDSSAVFILTSAPPPGGLTIIDAPVGKAHALISSTLTSTLPSRAASVFLQYDIRLTEASGKLRTISRGQIEVLPDVSHST